MEFKEDSSAWVRIPAALFGGPSIGDVFQLSDNALSDFMAPFYQINFESKFLVIENALKNTDSPGCNNVANADKRKIV